MIAIVDYGMGNLRSVQKALEKVGATAVVTDSPDVIAKSEKIVLPGVGAIAPAMDKLKNLELIEPIKNAIKTGKPFLGICLGLQLLFDQSDEGGVVETLGVIPGSVVRFTNLKVPHMGWNQINIKQKDCSLLDSVEEGSNVYFCHSFFVKPKNNAVTATKTNYGLDFTSSISKDNIFGVQFHPEKSQEIGLKILKNFNKLK